MLVILVMLEEVSRRWIAADDDVGDKLFEPRDKMFYQRGAVLICFKEVVKSKLVLFAAMHFVASVNR
jgi:hypothetical protein